MIWHALTQDLQPVLHVGHQASSRNNHALKTTKPWQKELAVAHTLAPTLTVLGTPVYRC